MHQRYHHRGHGTRAMHRTHGAILRNERRRRRSPYDNPPYQVPLMGTPEQRQPVPPRPREPQPTPLVTLADLFWSLLVLAVVVLVLVAIANSGGITN